MLTTLMLLLGGTGRIVLIGLVLLALFLYFKRELWTLNRQNVHVNNELPLVSKRQGFYIWAGAVGLAVVTGVVLLIVYW